MKNIQKALSSALSRLSDTCYIQSLDYFHLWLRIGQKYSQNPSDLIFDMIYGCRPKGPWNYISMFKGYSIGHLIPRFVGDAELLPTICFQ